MTRESQTAQQTGADHPHIKTPKLSVVVAVADPWPAIRTCLESLLCQVSDSSVEIIVTDGNGRALPVGDVPESVRWIRKPGHSIFQLRALGMAEARGDIVASTEDHCKVAPDWCRMLTDLHDQYRDAGAIGGAVENGTDSRILDRVHFLIANGPFMRPNLQAESRVITGQANVSFKREILTSDLPEAGAHQMEMIRDLAGRGTKLRVDDRLVVWHIQSLGIRGTCRMHFHTGRCIASFRLLRLSRFGRILRAGSCAILPVFLTARTVRTVLRKKRYRVSLAAGLPILVLLSCCHTLGELAGYLLGPGNSPQMAR